MNENDLLLITTITFYDNICMKTPIIVINIIDSFEFWIYVFFAPVLMRVIIMENAADLLRPHFLHLQAGNRALT